MKKITLLLAIGVISSCMPKKLDLEKEGEVLMQLSRDWSKSAATDDVEKTLSYWSEDAIFISSGQTTLKGKESIREMVVAMSKTPGFSIKWEPMSVRVAESGDMAYMIEKNTLTFNDSLGNPVTSYGNAVTIWSKDKNGVWKNTVEISADDAK